MFQTLILPKNVCIVIQRGVCVQGVCVHKGCMCVCARGVCMCKGCVCARVCACARVCVCMHVAEVWPQKPRFHLPWQAVDV